MTYVLRIIVASSISLLAGGLALMPLDGVAHLGDIVLFLYLPLACVVLPGLSWWAAMRLMRML
jgi:hypothetical protein